MPRYVDADKILAEEDKAFRRFFRQCRSTAVAVYIRSVHAAFQSIVKRAATIHVAPVIFAKWEKQQDYSYICTNCKRNPPRETLRCHGMLTNYCPECGTNMTRREREDNNGI